MELSFKDAINKIFSKPVNEMPKLATSPDLKLNTYCVSIVTKTFNETTQEYRMRLISGLIDARSAQEALGFAVVATRAEPITLSSVINCDKDHGTPFPGV